MWVLIFCYDDIFNYKNDIFNDKKNNRIMKVKFCVLGSKVLEV